MITTEDLNRTFEKLKAPISSEISKFRMDTDRSIVKIQNGITDGSIKTLAECYKIINEERK